MKQQKNLDYYKKNVKIIVIMKRNRINVERVVSVVGFIFLIVAGIASLFMNGDKKSIIEKVCDTRIVIPIVHFTCAVIVFFTIFKPCDILLKIVLMVESVLTINTDYEQLGILFFYATIMLNLCKGVGNRHALRTLIILFIIHIISLLGTYTHGWWYTVIAYGSSAFSCVFYYWVYYILKAKLSCVIPTNIANNKTLTNVPQGSEISLKDYKLNERQIKFVIECLHNNLSYKELSDKYFVSISTVKKVFAEVYKIFNVSNLNELRMLLLQYQVKE